MTIKDIAQLSGYGIGTVSRVMNDQPGVSDKAKETILKVIRESNFEPNENARHLKRRSASSICIIIKGKQNMLFADILERIQNQLSMMDEDAMFEYIDEDGDEVECAIRLIRSRSPKGIMFLGANLSLFDERIQQLNIPCMIVTTDGSTLDSKLISSVSVNDESATYEMICYLIKKGHKNIGIIGGKQHSKQIASKRLDGCLRAFQDYHIPFLTEENYLPSRYTMESGYEAAKELLSKNPDITALFAFSDTLAIGAMRAACDLGLSVPEDLSIAGFDGINMARYSIPRLTTIRQDTEALAVTGVTLLLKHTHYNLAVEHQEVPYDLVEGESVRTYTISS